jgi:hypothetical protein
VVARHRECRGVERCEEGAAALELGAAGGHREVAADDDEVDRVGVQRPEQRCRNARILRAEVEV